MTSKLILLSQWSIPVCREAGIWTVAPLSALKEPGQYCGQSSSVCVFPAPAVVHWALVGVDGSNKSLPRSPPSTLKRQIAPLKHSALRFPYWSSVPLHSGPSGVEKKTELRNSSYFYIWAFKITVIFSRSSLVFTTSCDKSVWQNPQFSSSKRWAHCRHWEITRQKTWQSCVLIKALSTSKRYQHGIIAVRFSVIRSIEYTIIKRHFKFKPQPSIWSLDTHILTKQLHAEV